MWTLSYGEHEDRTPTHGYEPTREAAMAAFARGELIKRAAMSGIGGNPEIICSFLSFTGSEPICDIGRTEMPQRTSLLP
jgi:hypothetical protein